MTLSTDTILENRYRIEALLAQGGMGAIYRAYDLKLDISVAIKENFFQTPESIDQFQQEARILARLHHPNLPRVIDHFSFEEKQYLVMDFIEGRDLWELVETSKQPLDEQRVLDYIIQICEAVGYLHRQQPPIIHRDIKPQNIKVTPDGRAILVDFGVAKIAVQDSRTRTGAQAVTPGFSPPEQYGGMGTTPLSDIYALGATLYAVLTGRYPPDSISLIAGGAKFEPPNVINSKLSQQVSQAIEHAMQVKPELRPRSILDWQQELKAAQTGQLAPQVVNAEDGATIVLNSDTQAMPPAMTSTVPTPLPTGQPAQSKPPWPWIGLTAAALAAAIGIGAFLIGRSGPQPEAFEVEALLMALAATATAQIQAGVTSPNIDLNATLVALAATATTQTQLQALRVEETVTATPTTEVTATPAPATATPTVEPTATEPPPTATATPSATPTSSTPAVIAVTPTPGMRIAFVSNRTGNADIFIMNGDGSEQTNLTNDGANNDRHPTWSPDGRRLAFASSNIAEQASTSNTSIRVIQVDGNESMTLATQSDYPVWSPDGSRLVIYGLDDHLFIIDAQTGQGVQLTQGYGYHPSWSPDGSRLVFDDKSDLYLINSDGSSLARLTGSTADEVEPAWSPDGQQIAFVSNGEGNNEIYVLKVNETAATRLTYHPAVDRSPAWSPDGRQIIFASNRDGNWEIYSMNIDGSELKNLTRHPAADEQPAVK